MAEFSPDWGSIATAFGTKLRSIAGIVQVYDRYPDNPISAQDLACVVIEEPEFAPSSFTFGTVTVNYSGVLSIPIVALSTAQVELAKNDANQCRSLGLNIQLFFHSNRALLVQDKKAFVTLSAAKLVRLSPVAGGDYAGLELPYSISIQYASN